MRSSRLAEGLEANAQNAMFRVKSAVLAVFQESLDRLGWTVGRNVQIDYRWYGGDKERARIGAAELLALFARRHRGECQPRHIGASSGVANRAHCVYRGHRPRRRGFRSEFRAAGR
jgi:hypothetical protein